MANTLTWTIKVPTPDRATLDTKRPLDVEAHDQTTALVAGGPAATPGTVTVNVQPSPDIEDVRLVFISSDRYGADLKYSVDATGGAKDIVLDNPHLYVGAGMVGLLLKAPQKLKFSNGLGAGNDANITILVGRTAS
jgi:hypothetical protein